MSDATLLILASTVSTGLILGAIFALVAAGVTIVYGCVWLPNASNGQFFLLAALAAWSFTSSGWGSALAIIAVLALGIVLSMLLEWVLIRRLYDVPNRNVAYFVVTLGLTQIMSGIFSMTYGRWSDQFTLPHLQRLAVYLGRALAELTLYRQGNDISSTLPAVISSRPRK